MRWLTKIGGHVGRAAAARRQARRGAAAPRPEPTAWPVAAAPGRSGAVSA